MCASPTKLAVKAKHVNKDANFSPQRRRDLFRVRAEPQPDPRPDTAEHDRPEVGGGRAGGGRRGGYAVRASGRQGWGEEQALEGEAAATSRKGFPYFKGRKRLHLQYGRLQTYSVTVTPVTVTSRL